MNFIMNLTFLPAKADDFVMYACQHTSSRDAAAIKLVEVVIVVMVVFSEHAINTVQDSSSGMKGR